MADAKVFRLGGQLTLEDVAQALEDFLRIQKRMEVEGVRQSETSYFIQARQPDSWKKYIGMDQAIQIRLSVYGDMLTADLGAGRWVDKLGAVAAGCIVFAPLLLTAAVGAISQGRLPEEIFDFLQRFTFLGKPLDLCEEMEEERPKPRCCLSCGGVLPEGSKFCPSCGKPAAAANVCPVCGAALSIEGARFCGECGAPLRRSASNWED